ncbi:MAG: phosphate-starvation-inducible PsiE family protein [Halofilum sp. (in: g-proteobacteria)]
MPKRSAELLVRLRSAARELFNSDGRGLATYEAFARLVGFLLSVAVSVIIVLALIDLFWALATDVLATGESFDYATFQVFFEMVLTVLIALEFNHTLAGIVSGRGGLIQVRAVVLIGILVIVRKFILIDIESTSALFLMGLALAIFALGIVYWLVVDVDHRARRHAKEVDDTGA